MRNRKRLPNPPGVLTALLALSLLAGLASGCKVNHKKEIARYRRILDGEVPQEVNFNASDPLPLETALLLANAHNEQIARAGEDYLQALYDKSRAASAFMPTISLIPSYSKADSSDDRGNARSGDSGGDPTDPDDPLAGGGGRGSGSLSTGDSRLDVPVNLRMNLFNGFRDVANVRRAASEIERRRALLLDAQAVVLLDVARTYYEVLRSEQSAQVLRNSVAVQEERVRDMRAREEVGLAQMLDVAQSEAQAAAARVSLIAAETDVLNGRAVLALLTGADVYDSELRDGLEMPEDVGSVEELVEQAQAARQDLAAVQAAVTVARAGVQTAVGQYYPSVNLNLNYFISRESSPEDSLWNSLVSANLPLFTGGAIQANVKTAWSRYRQSVLDANFARRQVEQEVRVARENLRASAARLDELAVQVKAAAAALDLAERAYAEGIGTNLERLTAQDQLLTAELQIASDEYDRKFLYLNLLRVIGRLGTTVDAPAVDSPQPEPDPADPAEEQAP